MVGKRVTCSGCSLLCDDVIIRSDGLYIDEVFGACLKGKERFDQITSKNRILSSSIRRNGELVKVQLKEALDETLEIIKNSSKPLLYGFSTVSCEAQLRGIELAKIIDGYIDSNSTICQGKVLNTSKQTGMTLTTISEVINKADLLIFWGANVAESIPRLLNKTLFSRGKFRMTGREIKTIIIIDPVKTTSFGVMGVRDIALQIDPGKDLELIHVLKEECCTPNSIPPKEIAGIDSDDLRRLLIQLTNAENGVIFIGQGIVNSTLDSNVIKELLELVQMINAKQQKGRMSVMMLGGHYNMAGFDQVALSLTGKNQSLQFVNNQLVETSNTIISKIATDDFDCSIIVGTDAISHLPWELSKKLRSKPLILIDNKKSATFSVADIVLPSAITGIECEGLAYRLDHVPIALNKIVNPPKDIISDEKILSRLIEGLKTT
ncbi:MAG: formylmethanofuran dehydrogenase subunit B [Candidatus Lokiarchaeota archaeon]|nr:formylmethanofuran dehydrogenase subunit B [Candidatus Lokiarchaeota archaeon]